MTHRQLTAVVAGTAFGARVHVRALKVAGIAVAALVGRDPERTRHKAGRAGVPNAFVDLAEAMELRPDLVVVATPPATHAPLVRTALGGGAHVLCEKPFTLDTGEADDLARQATEAGLVSYIGHEFRFAECAALVARLIDEGAIGRPRLAAFVAHGGLVADPRRPMPEWWFDRQRGGGWLGASGSHALDRVRHWFGDVEAVSARLSVTGDRPADVAEDSFTLRLTTTSGVEATVQSTAGAWGPGSSLTRLAGTRGTLWIDDETGMGTVESVRGQVRLADRDGTRSIPVPPDLALPEDLDIDPALVRNVAPYVLLYRRMSAEITGRSTSASPVRPATFADGAATMRVLDAIRESAADSGRLVTVPSADDLSQRPTYLSH